MDELKGIAAIWGAVLSTWLALVRLLPNRPRFYVEPPERDEFGETIGDAVIRIINPSSGFVYVRDWKRIRRRGPKDALGLFTRHFAISDVGKPGGLSQLIPAGNQAAIEVIWQGECEWWVIFLWHQQWLLPITLPAIVKISSRKVEQYEKARRATRILDPIGGRKPV